ncbi:MAG: phage tail protein [Nitrospira sp.]
MNGVRSRSKDPYLSSRFAVQIKLEGEPIAGFSEVTGLQVEVELEEYREGGQNDHVHQFAGKVRYPARLVLKHGFVDSRALWDWQNEIIQGRVQRKNLSIVLHDSEGNARATWEVKKACPVKWSGPDFRANSAEVALETLELVHQGFARK